MPSAKQSAKEFKGKSGKSCICHYREMSKATGAQKPSESQKAKALWAMKAAWDRCEDYYDPARKQGILGKTRTRLDLWREHFKDPIAALAKALECLENPDLGLAFGFTVCRCREKEPTGKASGLARTHGTWCVCVHHPALGVTRGNMDHIVSFSSSLSGKRRWLSRRQCRLSPLSLRKRSRRMR